eukprot:CAMPEP_0203765634 /NCGR_PEP_ID=MMETSP0098-20131031/18517_1 /ASSEMBLY_ACC=CAM_ASM_000208 /TAXON_ID=96639 /ORGANISM=" , Strain NY0313808BC1" /LENGTH=1100 /DNA_ID=CAMNT_0050661901 /DNA_START=85 /DNA_END=3384 /DNA_ORIENTATION=+
MSLFDDWNSNTPAAATPPVDTTGAKRPTSSPSRAGNPFGSDESATKHASNPFAAGAKPPQNPFAAPGYDSRSNDTLDSTPKGRLAALSSTSLASFSSILGEDALDNDLDEDFDEDRETKPKFVLEPLHWHVENADTIKTMAVGGGTAIVVVSNDSGVEQVWAWEQVRGGSNTQITVPTLDGKKNPVHHVSICHLACHVLISLESGDNYYVNLKDKSSQYKARGPIQRLKDVVIESVAWNRQETSIESTGDILVGTSKGGIWEISIEFSKGRDKKQIKKVYQLGMSIPVCGLYMVKLDMPANKWFVMAATARPTRFYEFVGGPTMEAMFKTSMSPENQSFRELPGEMGYSELHCFTSRVDARPNSFALLSEAGLYIGNLSFGSQASGDKIASRHDMVYFPTKTKSSGEALVGPPLSAMETEFHYILLYTSWLVVLSKLSESVVHEQRIDTAKNGLTLGLTSDISCTTIWVYSKHKIQRLDLRNEDGNVWRLYLEQARAGDPSKFEVAYNRCKTDSQRDKVITLRADYHFSQSEFELAARYYAETKRSFEEVALMLIDKSKRDALKSYLTLKLQALPERNKTQRTIISVWVVELYLEKLTTLADSVGAVPTESDNDAGNLTELVESKFHQFLTDQRLILGPAKDTIYKLITNHGRDNDYLVYAMINGDYERVVVRYIQRGRHDKAVETLAQQSQRWRLSERDTPDSFVELYYKYSPELLEHCPSMTVDTWIEASFLDPCKLIPSLIRYSQQRKKENENDDEAVRYLEHCVDVQGNQDEAIHNLLIALYAGRKDDSSLRELLASPKGCFDLKYALRVCTEYQKKHACVEIYSAMGLYSEAVELALQVDQDLAKMNADMAKDSSTRRKLWLMIAKHEIESALNEDCEETPVQRALGILRESDALMIEDVLQFLPDVVAIGELKDEVCHSLEQYTSNIEQLKAEMTEFTETADSIRKEIDAQNDSFFIVGSGQICDLCSTPVLEQEFYVFPCTHCFHSDCLFRELSRHLPPDQQEKMEHLREVTQDSQINLRRPRSMTNDNADEGFDSELDDQEEAQPVETSITSKVKVLDDFMAASCPFCGDLMIQSISEPFVTKQEQDDAKGW